MKRTWCAGPLLLLALLACGGERPPDVGSPPVGGMLTGHCAAAVDAGVPQAPWTPSGGVQVLAAGIGAGIAPCVELTSSAGEKLLLTRSPALVPAGDYGVKVYPTGAAGAELTGHGPSTLRVEDSGARIAVVYHGAPVQGGFNPDAYAYDDMLLRYVRSNGIPAATLVVSAKGQVLFERAVGVLDAAGTRAAPVDTPMRLASVAKPFTAALIRELVAQGRLTLSTQVFGYLGTEPIAGMTVDPRVASITVENLLGHRGGWDRAAIGDTMFKAFTISQKLGLARHPTPAEIARFAMGEPLTHAPGATFAYSNLGYMLLGLVAEKASGLDYPRALAEYVLTPSGIDARDVFPGKGLPEGRELREPIYLDPFTCPDLYRFSTSPPFVACPDGGVHLETLVAHGGLVATGQAVTRFMARFRIDGTRRTSNASMLHTGAIEGTRTTARWHPTGLDVVVLFNKGRSTPAAGFYPDFDAKLDEAIMASPLRP